MTQANVVRIKALRGGQKAMNKAFNNLLKHLGNLKPTSNNVLVTDAWRANKTYAKEKGLDHYRIKSNDGKPVIKGLYPYTKC